MVGPENFSDQLIDLVSYSTDATPHSHRPEAAVWVTNSDQVSHVLALCNRERIPVTARGAGTSLAGLSVPVKGGLVMDLCRMNKIVEICIEDRVAVVQPGVVYADLERALAPHGFFFPPDPASGKVATIGGNVATNAGGMKGAKYGVTKDYVLGLKVVLADGRKLKTGSRCMKSSSGFDLTRLFVGSEGMLGVITEVTLKVNPKPRHTGTIRAVFDSLESAGKAVSRTMRSGIIPSVLEIIDKNTLVAINQNTTLNLPEAAAILLAETDGFTQEETTAQLDQIMAIFREHGASDVQLASGPREAEALWVARKSAGGVLFRLNIALEVEDLAVPLSKVAEMLKFISEVGEKYRLRIPTVGHAGDGNLHPAISYDPNDAEEMKRMHLASAELLGKVTELGGTLTGEHGIGLTKAPFMALEHGECFPRYHAGIETLFRSQRHPEPGEDGSLTCILMQETRWKGQIYRANLHAHPFGNPCESGGEMFSKERSLIRGHRPRISLAECPF